jgi:transposase InsO family protein
VLDACEFGKYIKSSYVSRGIRSISPFVLVHSDVWTYLVISVKMIRTDNSTEYVNKEFGAFLSAQGILHQTSCPNTPPQNGVAERKNRHILDVARSLMYIMNVPKFLWSEAVMTAT